MFKQLAFLSVLSISAVASATANACAWQLDPQQARLAFASVKNDHIAELHRFTELEGTWAGGNLTIAIPISGLDTLIPIRNERMAEHLFKAEQHPAIQVTATVPPQQIDRLQVAESKVLEVLLTLEIAGQRGQVPATVQVTKVDSRRLLATTVQPIMINSATFGLTEGIETLRGIAGLSRIDHVVPVTFSVAFVPAG